MALPFPAMSFSPFDILTAEEMNMMAANDQALAAGTGINDGAITPVKLSRNVAFKAYMTGNQGGSGNRKLAFNQTSWNVGGAYNTSTQRFVAPITAIYFFTLNTSSGDAARSDCSIYVNGSLYIASASPGASGALNRGAGISIDIRLNANDYVEFYHSSASTINGGETGNHSEATGRLTMVNL